MLSTVKICYLIGGSNMSKKVLIIIIAFTMLFPITELNTFANASTGEISEGEASIIYRNVTVYAPAVASTESGYVGVISTITVTIQSNGDGRVFVDTLPLTQVDMQGSARLAVKVASALVENDKNSDIDPSSFDYFFVVRTNSPVIGGPSAGAVMTVATVALLENWTLDDKTVMTGMINPDGSTGPIGGIPQKIDAANSVGATRFLIPKGQGTYTELQGWNIVTKSVYDYAWDNYGITVFEVGEINEAIENFTGYTFSYEGSNIEITTEDYIKSMKPLATRLLEDAEDLYNNASKNFENCTVSDDFPNYYRSEINKNLENAKTALEESEDWYDRHLYYTSTSKSFQSLISSRYVLYTCDYFDSGDNEYIQNLLVDVDNLYTTSSNLAKNAEIVDYISLQTIGAAQTRATEAKSYLDNAKNSNLYYVSDVLDFLYDIAFVVERCNSISWWIGIGDHFNKTGEITESNVVSIALEYIDEAQQSITYSNVILNEISGGSSSSSNYLTSAEVLLETARDDLDNGFPAAAFFESLEALVKANLALEIIGTNAENRIDFASEKASSSISKSRKQGIEPVLAVSYYEYAESLSNESDFGSAIIYYKYSGMIAGAVSFANASGGIFVSNYVGSPEVRSKYNLNSLIIIYFALIIGLLAGTGIGLIVGSLVGSKYKQKKPPIKYPPKTFDYGQRHYYPNNQVPRSMRDYYKKNK